MATAATDLNVILSEMSRYIKELGGVRGFAGNTKAIEKYIRARATNFNSLYVRLALFEIMDEVSDLWEDVIGASADNPFPSGNKLAIKLDPKNNDHDTLSLSNNGGDGVFTVDKLTPDAWTDSNFGVFFNATDEIEVVGTTDDDGTYDVSAVDQTARTLTILTQTFTVETVTASILHVQRT